MRSLKLSHTQTINIRAFDSCVCIRSLIFRVCNLLKAHEVIMLETKKYIYLKHFVLWLYAYIGWGPNVQQKWHLSRTPFLSTLIQ